MKNIILSFVLVFELLSFASAQTDVFKTDVTTDKKPWTNLEFYNDPKNFQFAIVSDNTGGSRPGVFATGVEKLNLMMPEFVLCVGDLIQGYTQDTVRIREEWDEFNGMIAELKVPFFYLPGNHDITNQVMQKEWEKRYGRRFYSFTYKDVLFIILDSNDDDDYNLTEDQTTFTIETLKAHPEARWTFVLMHHPIWKYDTSGRFERIESTLRNRKHTVIAGHEHYYQFIPRNETNYYVLSTTGGGSRLRGNRFGEFDHIVWVTLTDGGPAMANLRLDGILPHDISNAETASMAESILQNVSQKHMVLTNQGEKFTDGTTYVNFENNSEVPLKIEISFFHHHQVDIQPARHEVILEPGEPITLETSLKAHEIIDYNELGFLKYYWRIGYVGEEFKDFYLDGNADFAIEPGKPDYCFPRTAQFLGSASVVMNHPFENLKTLIKVGDQDEKQYDAGKRIDINGTTTISTLLKNEIGQVSATVSKTYEKIDFRKPVKAGKTIDGLLYEYFEGNWDQLPDYKNNKPLKTGIANDFSVSDLAVQKNHFGIRFTGFIDIPEDGLYHFRINADDAGYLKMHDRVVATHGRSYPVGSDAGVIALKAGLHPVEIGFFEQEGNERLRLYYRLNESDGWIFMELKDFFKTSNRKVKNLNRN